MKILNISSDKKIFSAESKTWQRVSDYSGLFDRFDLVVLTSRGYKSVVFKNSVVLPTNSVCKLFYLFDAYVSGKKLIQKYNHDAISAQDPFEMGLVGLLLAKKFKLKLQIQIHGDYFGSRYWKKENPLNLIRYYLGKYIVSRADAVRVVSERIKNNLVFWGIKQEKITVVPIYTPIYHEILTKKRGDRFVFLTAGRLVPVKNIFMQIKAVAEVLKKHSNIELWIVGDGPEKEKLRAESKKLKAEKNIKFFGWIDNLDEFYKQADVFLLTSNYEGWGLVVIEAASFSLPIIMTDVGCAGEVVKSGENGIVINVGNEKDLADSMNRFIENENFSRKMGEGAKRAVESLPNKEENLKLLKQSFDILFK